MIESEDKKHQNDDQAAPGGAMGPDSTTGSGISEAERRIHDGTGIQSPADPANEKSDTEDQDYPGNDSRH